MSQIKSATRSGSSSALRYRHIADPYGMHEVQQHIRRELRVAVIKRLHRGLFCRYNVYVGFLRIHKCSTTRVSMWGKAVQYSRLAKVAACIKSGRLSLKIVPLRIFNLLYLSSTHYRTRRHPLWLHLSMLALQFSQFYLNMPRSWTSSFPASLSWLPMSSFHF